VSDAKPTPDKAPGIDDFEPITSKGEPRKSPPQGGRPRLTPEEREARNKAAADAKASGTRVAPEVTQALAVMNNAYSLITAGLMMLGAPRAASELSDRIPAVQEQNRLFLIADPKLAQRISKIGSSTGRAGFLITNLGMLTAVAMTASTELALRRPAKSAPTAAGPQQSGGFPDETPQQAETPASSPLFPGGFGGV